MNETPTLSSILVYPVKSCRGIALAEAALDEFGLAHDRRFMVVGPDAEFITQRQEPRLALIETSLLPNGVELRWPGFDPIVVPFRDDGATLIPARVWKHAGFAEDCGDPVGAWLTAAIGRTARLVRLGTTFQRSLEREHIPKEHRAAFERVPTSFADDYPFLMLSEASLEDLNGRLEIPLPMNRFRPNLVVRGCLPYAEDTWQRFRIGDAIFRHGGPCPRCVITTTDQETAVRGKEPLRTLARYRRTKEGVMFGQNLLAECGTHLRVGDRVEILSPE